MIDIHTHLLPGIDDGVKSLDEAVQIIKRGAAIGITSICITPHLQSNFGKFNPEVIMENFSKLRDRINREDIDVHLHLGSEIDLREDINHLKEISFCFINQARRYLLLELPIGDFPSFAERILFSLVVENLSPILAHPERSLTREKDFERIEKLTDSGVLIQLNAGSIVGDFGKKAQKVSERLLEKDLVDFVASDTHDLNNRPITIMAEALRRIKMNWGEEKALRLFRENPRKILKAERIEREISLK